MSLEAHARARRRTEWLAFVAAGLPGAALAVLWAIDVVPERLAVLAFAPSYIGLNLVHMAGTYTRAYLGREGFRHAPTERVAIPAALVLSSIVLDAAGATLTLLALQYYLSIHHGLMQTYGILRAGQRRAGRALSARALRLDQGACLLLPMGALVYRARAVCHTYEGLPLAAPPAWLAAALATAGALALVAFVARELRARLCGEAVDPLGVALVVSTNLVWSALLVAIDHPLLPLYAIASGHYAQQIYFVWRFCASPDALARVPSALRAAVAPPSRTGFVLALAVLGGGVLVVLTGLTVAAQAAFGAAGLREAGALAIPPWLSAMIGINLSHYWLESRVWRAPASKTAIGVGSRAAA